MDKRLITRMEGWKRKDKGRIKTVDIRELLKKQKPIKVKLSKIRLNEKHFQSRDILSKNKED